MPDIIKEIKDHLIGRHLSYVASAELEIIRVGKHVCVLTGYTHDIINYGENCWFLNLYDVDQKYMIFGLLKNEPSNSRRDLIRRTKQLTEQHVDKEKKILHQKCYNE